MDIDAPNFVETHDDIQLAQGVEPVSEESEQKPFGSNSVEHDLLRPIGQSKMIGDEDELFNEGIHSAGIASNAMNNKRSIRYLHHDEDGNPVGALQIMTHGPRSKKATIQNVYVAQDNRRQKIATGLLKRARQDYDVKHSKELTEQGSAFAKYTKSYGGGVPSYIPEERVEDLARRLITFSYAVAPLVPRVKGTYAEGGSVDDPIASAVDTARNLSPMGFYSAAAEAASKFPQKAPIDQIVNKIKGQPNVKKEELDNANLADAFAGQRSVDPQEVARHLQASVPQISEKVYGGKPTVKYEPKALLERPKGFENTDDVYEVGPQGKPPHLIAVNGNNFDVWGPSGYHNSFDSFNDAVEYANQSIHGVEPTEYSQYTIPGGENYREVVMHLPPKKNAPIESGPSAATILFENNMKDKYGSDNFFSIYNKLSPSEIDKYEMLVREDRNSQKTASMLQDKENNYKSSHWKDPNVVAHLRLSDRDDGKTLHMEELQSDWGQEGREEGFGEGKVPVGPYVTSTDQWVDLGLKRALMEAAKGGYDKLIWTPGKEQANRYKLNKHVEALAYDPEDKVLSYLPHGGNNGRGYINIPQTVEPNEIKKHIGKEAAKKLLETEPNKLSGNHVLSGLDLEVGGEGMEAFYDRLVPQRLSKLVSQYDKDAKIDLFGHDTEQSTYDLMSPNGKLMGTFEDKNRAKRISENTPGTTLIENKRKAHAIQITPKLREAILKGLPAFKSGGDVGYDRGGSIIKRALDVVSKLPQ